MDEDLVKQTCRRIFEEDWDYFAERPTMIDAVERIVAEAIALAHTQHVTYTADAPASEPGSAGEATPTP